MMELFLHKIRSLQSFSLSLLVILFFGFFDVNLYAQQNESITQDIEIDKNLHEIYQTNQQLKKLKNELILKQEELDKKKIKLEEQKTQFELNSKQAGLLETKIIESSRFLKNQDSRILKKSKIIEEQRTILSTKDELISGQQKYIYWIALFLAFTIVLTVAILRSNRLAKRSEKELKRAKSNIENALEKQKELGELKSRFVSTASHQFRTPLTVIRTNLSILAMQKDGMSEKLLLQFNKVNLRIIDQITRMTQIMDDVLLLGKIDSGTVKPTLLPANLIDLCEEINSSYNLTQADGRKIKLETNGGSKPISIDTNLVEHAISNLVSNAFKYSEDKPSPKMVINFEDTFVEVLIQDYGIGIPKKDLQYLFDPFYRASNTNEVSGTGLGTSIAKEYLELCGASLKVKSELNQGSVFIITFKR